MPTSLDLLIHLVSLTCFVTFLSFFFVLILNLNFLFFTYQDTVFSLDTYLGCTLALPSLFLFFTPDLLTLLIILPQP